MVWEDRKWQKHRNARKDDTCARKPSSTTSSRTSTSRRLLMRNTLLAAPPRPPACWFRIRSARNGILARVAFPLFVDKPHYHPDVDIAHARLATAQAFLLPGPHGLRLVRMSLRAKGSETGDADQPLRPRRPRPELSSAMTLRKIWHLCETAHGVQDQIALCLNLVGGEGSRAGSRSTSPGAPRRSGRGYGGRTDVRYHRHHRQGGGRSGAA
jgi:hypothetical protein